MPEHNRHRELSVSQTQSRERKVKHILLEYTKSLCVYLFLWLPTPPTQSGAEQPNLAHRCISGP